MTRIKSDMNVMQATTVMAEGNPGAVSVLVQLFGIDNLPTMLALDTFGIYGSDIWMLYKDVCGEDIEMLKDVIHRTLAGKEMTLQELKFNIQNGIRITYVEE